MALDGKRWHSMAIDGNRRQFAALCSTWAGNPETTWVSLPLASVLGWKLEPIARSSLADGDEDDEDEDGEAVSSARR